MKKVWKRETETKKRVKNSPTEIQHHAGFSQTKTLLRAVGLFGNSWQHFSKEVVPQKDHTLSEDVKGGWGPLKESRSTEGWRWPRSNRSAETWRRAVMRPQERDRLYRQGSAWTWSIVCSKTTRRVAVAARLEDEVVFPQRFLDLACV